VSVTWNGSSLILGAVAAVSGFTAEIHDNDGERIRVDFESTNDQHRVEVRIDGGQIEVRID
jgi:hypothetical protein